MDMFPEPDTDILTLSIEDLHKAFKVQLENDSSAERLRNVVKSNLQKSLTEHIVHRELLIHCSEAIRWEQKDLEDVVTGLYIQALELRDTRVRNYEETLAIALRTVGFLAPLSFASKFSDFLRAEDTPRVKHTALTGLKVMFSGGPSGQDYPLLWKRLANLLDKYLDIEFTSCTEISALSMSTFIAATLSGYPSITYYLRDVLKLPKLLKYQIVTELERTTVEWARPQTTHEFLNPQEQEHALTARQNLNSVINSIRSSY